jgi:hypothetical protein
MNTKTRIGLIILFAALLIVVVSRCNSSSSALEGTENILKGLQDNLYPTFSHDMDTKMLASLKEADFIKLQEKMATKIGKCTSREVTKVEQTNEYYSVLYTVTCEKSKALSMRVVITRKDPIQVTGLWFNAPELK